ncbi:MAG: hypothetical protein E7554_05110 [Ruminococcaceae bacterium]|nr:hypothetical protein [Oscillospiraceae bacterium]
MLNLLNAVSRFFLTASDSVVSGDIVTGTDAIENVVSDSVVSASQLVENAGDKANNLFVVLLGVGTVFAGLIALIIICKLMGLFFAGGKNTANEPVKAAPVAAEVVEDIPDRQEMVAAISAVLAEELGTDVSAIRIHSINRV